MEVLNTLFAAAYELMDTPMTLFGFTFSYWDVYLWSILAIIIGALIVRFLIDE